ncbi:MAG: hypothetical protein HQ472_04745 [Ignavibacteria bacterium]|nr:hypothetical protein [Ignavibacteria bacterium]
MWLKIIVGLFLVHTAACADTLFVERFDDPNLLQRGWYDFNVAGVDSSVKFEGAASLACNFAKGALTPSPLKAMRRQFTPSTSVYLRYYVRYSENWTGSNKPYHPHEFSFTTNADDKYVGPAWTHLTTYIEHNEGVPVLALQDGRNINVSVVKQDVSQTTQDRSTCGCNGTIDGYTTDCYNSGTEWRNGKQWRAAGVWFADEAGPRYKSDWHKIEAYFQLNTIANGKGVNDGIVRYWYDDVLLIDKSDVEMRTAMQPSLAFNQFLVVPYIGDGSPVAQTMWIDDLVVGTKRTVVGTTSVLEDGISAADDEIIGVYDLFGRHISKTLLDAPRGVCVVVARAKNGSVKTEMKWKE